MQVDVKSNSNNDASVTSLVSGIINDAQELFKQQIELLKHEVREDLRKTKEASQMLGVGLGIAMLGAILVAMMCAYLLNWAFPQLPLWACFGICGGVLVAVGVGIFYVAIGKFGSFNPLPDQSAQALKENVQWITNPK